MRGLTGPIVCGVLGALAHDGAALAQAQALATSPSTSALTRGVTDAEGGICEAVTAPTIEASLDLAEIFGSINETWSVDDSASYLAPGGERTRIVRAARLNGSLEALAQDVGESVRSPLY